jgi:hypothetical protein
MCDWKSLQRVVAASKEIADLSHPGRQQFLKRKECDETSRQMVVLP